MNIQCHFCNLMSFRLLRENCQHKFQEQYHHHATDDQVQVINNHTVVDVIDAMVTVITIVIKLVRNYPADQVISITVMLVNV